MFDICLPGCTFLFEQNPAQMVLCSRVYKSAGGADGVNAYVG